MKIIIPSMGRSDILSTAKQLQFAGIPKKYECFIVVIPEERNIYEKYYGDSFRIISVALRGTNNVRQFVIENCNVEDNKILMMDDDLRFFHRPDMDNVSLYQSTGEQILEMVRWIEQQLENYAHVGIPTRTQNFQLTSRMEKAKSFELKTVRLNHLHAFRKDIILGEELNFHGGLEINVMEDFNMVLNLLELGYPNIMSCKWAHNQRFSNSRGGATSYRSLELLKICALKLKEQHPQVVTVVQKTTKSSWGGTPDNPVTRTDVRIQWQKSLGIRAGESKL